MFPLILLPSVALQEIVKHIQLNDLITLSFCSKRIHKLTKLFAKRRAHETNIEVVYHLCAEIFFIENDTEPKTAQHPPFQVFDNSEMSENLKFETIKTGSSVVPMAKRTIEKAIVLDFYFETMTEGIKILLDYITAFLDRPIYGMNLGSNLFPNQVRDFLDWTLIRQRSIESIHISCDFTKDQAIRDILDVCNSANYFTLEVKPTGEFRHEFSFKNDQFCIFDAFWFSFKNLLAIDCRYFHIYDSNLTNQEMNQFLRHWKAGGCNKMREIYIAIDVIDLEELLSDLNAVPFPKGVVRKYIDDQNEENEVSYGFDIQRNDGVLATIQHEGGNVIKRYFRMVVWE